MREWLLRWLSALGSRLSGWLSAIGFRPTENDGFAQQPIAGNEPLRADSRQPAAAEPESASQPNWPLLYGAVIGELVILILIFYAFTKAFA